MVYGKEGMVGLEYRKKEGYIFGKDGIGCDELWRLGRVYFG